MSMLFTTYSNSGTEWEFIKGFRTQFMADLKRITGDNSCITETENSNLDVACADSVTATIIPTLEYNIMGAFTLTFVRGTSRTTSSTGSTAAYNVRLTHNLSNVVTGLTQTAFSNATVYGHITKYRSWKYGIISTGNTIIIYIGNYSQKIVNQAPLIQVMYLHNSEDSFYLAQHAKAGTATDSGIIAVENNTVLNGGFVDRFPYLYDESSPNHIAIFPDKVFINSNNYKLKTTGLIDSSNIDALVGQIFVINNSKYYAFSGNTLIPLIEEGVV